MLSKLDRLCAPNLYINDTGKILVNKHMCHSPIQEKNSLLNLYIYGLVNMSDTKYQYMHVLSYMEFLFGSNQ